MYNSIKEIVTAANETGKTIAELTIEQECQLSGKSRDEIWQRMTVNLQTMQAAVQRGESGRGVFSQTHLTGGEAVKIKNYRASHHPLSGDVMMAAVQGAIATNEVNAAMGVVCATPTAGSSGTLPGILFMLKERLSLTKKQMINFLFTAGGVGLVIANHAGIAGAMGAANGTPEQSAQAMSITISNLLGLVCDPIAGLVEIPCVKRNAIGAGNALIAADMALAGCTSKIPTDECIMAMDKVGRGLPASLRETGIGWLAGTPTGQAIKARIFGNEV